MWYNFARPLYKIDILQNAYKITGHSAYTKILEKIKENYNWEILSFL